MYTYKADFRSVREDNAAPNLLERCIEGLEGMWRDMYGAACFRGQAEGAEDARGMCVWETGKQHSSAWGSEM